MRGLHKLNHLNEKQRTLVVENLGLVGHHLRTHVGGLQQPSRDREWDDLFQEGCIGLILAAKTFDHKKGIVFSNYARRRIQAAVHRGLHRAFETVRTPEGELRSRDPQPRQRRHVLSFEKDRTIPDRSRRSDPHQPPNSTTIRERMREKMDHALTEAARDELRPMQRNQVPEGVVTRLVEERLRIPRDDCRTPLRQISRDTSRSYASLVYVEKRLIQRVRKTLAHDPEFDELRSAVRKRREGWDACIDRTTPHQNLDLEFEKRWLRATSQHRAAVVFNLIQRTQSCLNRWARDTFDTLPRDKQRLFLNHLSEVENEADS